MVGGWVWVRCLLGPGRWLESRLNFVTVSRGFTDVLFGNLARGFATSIFCDCFFLNWKNVASLENLSLTLHEKLCSAPCFFQSLGGICCEGSASRYSYHLHCASEHCGRVVVDVSARPVRHECDNHGCLLVVVCFGDLAGSVAGPRRLVSSTALLWDTCQKSSPSWVLTIRSSLLIFCVTCPVWHW